MRFQGQYAHEETGLFYKLNRYYDPRLGRYLTADPIKLIGGLNPYIYVDGNPVRLIDPLGLKGMPGYDWKPTGDRNPEPEVKRSTTGSDIDEKTIQDALNGDITETVQNEVSLPMIQRYYDRLQSGEVPPAISMDGNVITEGNHRYVVGKIFGKMPEVKPGVLPQFKLEFKKLVGKLKVSPNDWDKK
ncbi:RHS repeat-associated core domain-containing protein [Budvicia aquatica]|uniref:RHS repeat-associated core domain-containing protein n=1 Tax=Budvicia aquatica TaxID=82979 RepID=UPI002009F797